MEPSSFGASTFWVQQLWMVGAGGALVSHDVEKLLTYCGLAL